MATQPCPNIAQVTFKLQSDAQDIQNSLYFETATGYAPGDMAAIAAAAEGSWLTNVLPLVCNDVRFVQAIATDLTSLAGERAITTPDFGNVGTHAGTSMPLSVCLAIQLQTGDRGRGKQGRIFAGPLPESVVTENLVDSTYADDYVAALEAVVAAVIAAHPGLGHVVLSRYSGGVKRANGIGISVHGIGYSNLYVDVQKDRLPFHKKRKKRTP